MSNPTVLFRSLLVYGLCLPLALFLGYLLANPLDFVTFVVVGAVFLLLTAPLFLKYYHVWLLATWNMSVVVFFLPGRPQLWMLITAIGLGIAVLQYILSREHRLISVPSLTWPLLAIAAVVLLTAQMTGGIGMRSFGSNVYGGKRYFLMLLAILGYFVMVSRTIPFKKANLYVALFFLGSCTMVVGSTAGMLPSSFSWLYVIFPIENLGYLSNITQSLMTRSWGLALLSLGVFCAMLTKYGVQGILDLQRPYRLFFFLGFVFIGLLGGFRSVLIIYIMTFGILLYLEGMMRTRLLPAMVLTVILGGALLTAFATSLPLSVQRSLAFLPIRIDPIAKLDAQASSEWRIRMWKNVLPEIPQNLFVGKGYLFSSTDDWMYQFKGGEEGARGSELVGDYHNGPLSVILPFGLPGVLTFCWFLFACGRALYRNYKFSIPEYRIINTFLFAYFVARVIFFFAVFGSLYSDLAMFTGIVGLSVSLNGGVSQPEAEPAPQFVFGERNVPAEAEPQPVA